MEFVYIHVRFLFILLGAFAMPLFILVQLWGNSKTTHIVSSTYGKAFKSQLKTSHRFDSADLLFHNTATGPYPNSSASHTDDSESADFRSLYEEPRLGDTLMKNHFFSDKVYETNANYNGVARRSPADAERELSQFIARTIAPLAVDWSSAKTLPQFDNSIPAYGRRNGKKASQYFWGDVCEHRQGLDSYGSEAVFRHFSDLCLALPHTQGATPFPNDREVGLFHVAAEFLDRIRSGDFLPEVKDSIYDEAPHLDLVSTLTYIDNVLQRLPKYRSLLEKIASEQYLDWRLLAAITYQESHWNPKAVSPTGVRGLMMLTKRTAEELGIDNRLDPEQSVRGGARYLNAMRQRFNADITGIDRLWMALASYNVGFGHLQDARALTRKSGADPNKWQEVKKRLPLLSKPKWYRKTRFGYARGHESVQFVENIRSYCKILVWLTSREAKLMLVKNEITEDEQNSL